MASISPSHTLDPYIVAPRSVLCLSTHRSQPIASELFASCSVVHVHNVHLATRKAKLGVYDLYCVVPTERDSSGALHLWEQVRQFDSSTPFLFLTERTLRESHVGRLRSGFDGIANMSQGLAHAQNVLTELMQHCAVRSFAARETTEAMLLGQWLKRVSGAGALYLSPQSYARVQEAVLRAYASTSFFAAGGSRAWFERLWPALFEDSLQRSYTATDVSMSGDAREAARLSIERASAS